MIAAFAALLALAEAVDDPVDWACATLLIQKNYKQPYKPEILARRIADECARAFRSSDTGTLRIMQESIYGKKMVIFRGGIEEEIKSRRLRDEIKLVR